MSNKRQRTSNNKSEVVFEYTGNGQTVPKDIVSVRFHPSATKIGFYAFSGCTELKEVVLSEGLTSIGSSAFQECSSLQSVTIPSSVMEIGRSVFFACNNLREVVLNEGLKKIGGGVFNYCSSLESITIPSTVIEIEKYAFSYCTRLREVILHNEDIQITDRAFYRCTSFERFKFPSLFTRLDNIIQAGQRDIEAKMDDIPTVEWRGGELITPTVHREVQTPRGMKTLVEVDKEKLGTIVRLIQHYEIKEATTLLELALWEARIDQSDISNPADRGAYRVEVPGPVKDAILQYLR